ncbi:TIGR02281 family clan AA aspartic protease [Aquibium carbonis]|uniref:TIGR02281 family clan AA aspartic protease n=1 Tax=Aquibium carbonis TaxID=2495581 RepID=A0A3S0A9G6_9HYPH|nr:TIGR02281 family clan AA aspartic protease [Aquibium carbonis]RST87744.1 TIGR02281 family clan AA aspartic protease [Aquibium carbonis]
MKRLLLALCAIVAAATAVPLVYQSDPERFHDMASWALRPAEPEPVPVVMLASPRETGVRQLTGRRIEIPIDRRGHFSAEFRVNGTRLDAMIDTGATLVAINRSTAARIGLNLMAKDFVYKVDTANGPALAAAAVIDSLQIGRIRLDGVEAVVLEDKSLKQTLVGMSFLNRLSAFRVERGTLLLEQ